MDGSFQESAGNVEKKELLQVESVVCLCINQERGRFYWDTVGLSFEDGD